MPLRHGYASRVEVSDLTRRERMVLEHVRQGESNKEIAEGLIMSISTVKAHVRNIMQKTGATNRIQLALNAERYSGQAN
ncbi:response regulator transcription factor [Acidisoma silvae]|uniref:Response regulator transcription factor n=2 Tax=Acidisoma silvae TaxID=2802396 RepID=A0A963YSV5_9PROT|nr:response regulator transcription factor [Acidisoma silvae]